MMWKNIIFLMAVVILCLGATGCATVDNAAGNQVVQPLEFSVKGTYDCSNEYVGNYLEELTAGRLVPVVAPFQPDYSIEVEEKHEAQRSLDWRMWGNIGTVCVGYFYHYYDIDTLSSASCELVFKSGNRFSFEEFHKVTYSHPGYISPLPKGWREGEHYFYDKIKRKNREAVARKVAIAVLKRISENRLTNN